MLTLQSKDFFFFSPLTEYVPNLVDFHVPYLTRYNFFSSSNLFIRYKPIGAAPQGHFFVGGGRGRLDKKGCNASRGATNFREERNPPQADSIVSVFFNRE